MLSRPTCLPGRLTVVAMGLLAWGAAVVCAEQSWPQFRGPGNCGISENEGLPAEWDSEKNVAWAVEVPGLGWSSPIVWGDKVFVTTAVNSAGTEQAPRTGIYMAGRGGNSEHAWLVNGILSCYDALTGDPHYKQRVGGNFTASPWAYDGKVFCLSENGETSVVQTGPEFKIVARNDLDEMCLATPAIVRDRLLIRTATKLYCIRDRR